MNNAVEGVDRVPQRVDSPRRLLLEKQLDLAIQKAQKRYRKVDELQAEKKAPNSSHLGCKIDIFA